MRVGANLRWLFITFLAAAGCVGSDSADEGDDRAGGWPEEVGGALSVVESPAGRYMRDELLVQYLPGADDAGRASVRGRLGAELLDTIHTGPMQADGRGKLEVLRLPPGLGIATAVGALESDATVDFAEPNWVYEHTAVSNDPDFGLLWGMQGDATSPANAFGSQAGEAWAAGNTGSSAVYVGIIDEGYMFEHEDLAANAWSNPFDAVGDLVDNDGNGYVDDQRGWDFANNDNSVFDGTSDDHGTHVAGTIGAVGGNGVGVVGVNWQVTLISAKFLGRNGGTTANAIKAVDYLTDLKIRHGLNVVATNNSWGGGGFSQALSDAIERAGAADILFIAAAGNGGKDGVGDNNDQTPHYPSSYGNANIIAVASITSTGAKSGFSNFGAVSVDIGAPGSSIRSTLPGRRNASDYGSYSGTSMATPHVSGAAALYAAAHPGSSAADIKAAILGSAVATPALAGKCVSGGRLDASGFFAPPLPAE